LRRPGESRIVLGGLRTGRIWLAGYALEAIKDRLHLGKIGIVVLGMTHCCP
jgi:hypothetical protein